MNPGSHRMLALGCAALLAISGATATSAIASSGHWPTDKGGGGSGGGGNGNGGGGDGGGGNGGGGGRNPIVTPPSTPTPPTPVAPGSPAAPRNPIAPGNSGGGNGGGGSGGGGSGKGGGNVPRTVGAVPKGVPTSGLRAGRGAVAISYFVDFNDVASAGDHLRIAPALLSRLSSESLGTITLRPLMGIEAGTNSTEAACALVSSSQQNRAWVVASALATARVTTDGDWLSTVKLRSIGRRSGVSVQRFVQGATSRSCYRKLTTIRAEALALKVGASPTYVVKGPGGQESLTSPGSADEVIAAVRAVS